MLNKYAVIVLCLTTFTYAEDKFINCESQNVYESLKCVDEENKKIVNKLNNKHNREKKIIISG